MKIKDEIKILEDRIKVLKNSCKHKDLDKTSYGTATCNECGKYFDWYCETSPTLECDYRQEDGSYNTDSCRYCGMPRDRQ